MFHIYALTGKGLTTNSDLESAHIFLQQMKVHKTTVS